MALNSLTQSFQEVSLGNLVDTGALNAASSADTSAQYSSSESSIAADNLASQLDSGGSLLDAYGASRSAAGDARAGGGAQGQAEGKGQICFDFTKGVCQRGDKCKYSHDLATIVHFNSKEKGICFDYLRNQCHRGLLCRFSHDLSNIAQQCQVYTNGAKESKGAKPNAICYDFVKGVCQRGVECRYSHDLSLIARMARGGTAQPKAGEVCYDYLRGRCNRGATCKYSHNIAFLAAPGFLGSAMSSDGPPMAAQASGGGAPPMGALPLGAGGGFPVPMGNLPGMAPPRLASTLSADQATLNQVLAAAGHGAVNQMFAAQAAALQQQSNGMAAAAEAAAQAAEGRRRSGSATGEPTNDTLTVNDQPPGGWAGSKASALSMQQQAQAAMLSRMSHMASMQQAMGHHVPVLGGQAGGEGMMGGAAMYGKPPGMGQFNGPDALRRPPLPPSQLPPEFAALLASGMQDNPHLIAETFAAAAKAQNVRLMSGAGALGSGANGAGSAPSSGILASFGSGSLPPMHGPVSAIPQPIPQRDGMGYDMVPPGGNPYGAPGGYPGGNPHQQQPGGGGGVVMDSAGHLSRSAPAGGPLNNPNVNPDLLPMIKEIWSKPGVAI